ncbi:hypothetical protein ACFCXT_09785 [Streptomyces vinaceus]|uniref:hypothetical protein n=1 Tax=Streptomyces vinaceus TaxID=1960 RepID=UPI0035E0E5AB
MTITVGRAIAAAAVTVCVSAALVATMGVGSATTNHPSQGAAGSLTVSDSSTAGAAHNVEANYYETQHDGSFSRIGSECVPLAAGRRADLRPTHGATYVIFFESPAQGSTGTCHSGAGREVASTIDGGTENFNLAVL